jgi:hypothetical protein
LDDDEKPAGVDFGDASKFKMYIGSATSRSQFTASRFSRATASNFDMVLQQAQDAAGSTGRLALAWTVRSNEEPAAGTPAGTVESVESAARNNKATSKARRAGKAKPVEYRLLISTGITAVVPRQSHPSIFTVNRDNSSFEEITLTKEQAEACTDARKIEEMMVSVGSEKIDFDHVLPNSVHVWKQAKEKEVEAIAGSSHCVFFTPPPGLQKRMRVDNEVEYLVLGVAVGFSGDNEHGLYTWDSHGVRHTTTGGKGHGKTKTDLHNDYTLQLKRVKDHCTQLTMEQGHGVYTPKHHEAWARAITSRLLPTDLELQQPLWGPRSLGAGLEPRGAWGAAHRCPLLQAPVEGEGHPSQHAAAVKNKSVSSVSSVAVAPAGSSAPSISPEIRSTSALKDMDAFDLMKHASECNVDLGNVNFSNLSAERERIFVQMDRERFERERTAQERAKSEVEAKAKAKAAAAAAAATTGATSSVTASSAPPILKKVATLDDLTERLGLYDDAVTSTQQLLDMSEDDFAELLQSESAHVSGFGSKTIREEHQKRRTEAQEATQRAAQAAQAAAQAAEATSQATQATQQQQEESHQAQVSLSPADDDDMDSHDDDDDDDAADDDAAAAADGDDAGDLSLGPEYEYYSHEAIVCKVHNGDGEMTPSVYSHTVMEAHGLLSTDLNMDQQAIMTKIGQKLRARVSDCLGDKVAKFEDGDDPFAGPGQLLAGLAGSDNLQPINTAAELQAVLRRAVRHVSSRRHRAGNIDYEFLAEEVNSSTGNDIHACKAPVLATSAAATSATASAAVESTGGQKRSCETPSLPSPKRAAVDGSLASCDASFSDCDSMFSDYEEDP